VKLFCEAKDGEADFTGVTLYSLPRKELAWSSCTKTLRLSVMKTPRVTLFLRYPKDQAKNKAPHEALAYYAKALLRSSILKLLWNIQSYIFQRGFRRSTSSGII